MSKNDRLEPPYLSKLQLKQLKRRKNSPEAEAKLLMMKNTFKDKLRYISPQLQAKTSRPKSSSQKPGMHSSYEGGLERYYDSHTSSKRRSVQVNVTKKEQREKESSNAGKGSGSKVVKRETVKIANNLKDILEKHLAYKSEKKKTAKKEGSKEKEKEKEKYLTPRKLEPYERQLRKSSKKPNTSSRGFSSSFQKLEQIHLKQTQKPKIKKFQMKDENTFDYVLKYSYRSRKGHTPNNPSKPNQDAYIISTNLHHQTCCHYFGVCDGHGSLGHKVSAFLKHNLPESFKKAKNLSAEPVENLIQCFQQTSLKLRHDSKIDISLSGATCVGCYMNKDTLYCCNVGDSRAIIGRHEKKWVVHQLSEDHKPTLQTEAERIKQNKGVIQPFKHPDGTYVGPMRVWLPQGNGPGLAMTRSFGDMIAASVGVSSIPQIREYKMSRKDRIIVIASDGVWEFMENIEVINLLSPFYESDELQLGCDKLLYTVYNRWIQNSTVIDDITFIVIFLYYE